MLFRNESVTALIFVCICSYSPHGAGVLGAAVDPPDDARWDREGRLHSVEPRGPPESPARLSPRTHLLLPDEGPGPLQRLQVTHGRLHEQSRAGPQADHQATPHGPGCSPVAGRGLQDWRRDFGWRDDHQGVGVPRELRQYHEVGAGDASNHLHGAGEFCQPDLQVCIYSQLLSTQESLFVHRELSLAFYSLFSVFCNAHFYLFFKHTSLHSNALQDFRGKKFEEKLEMKEAINVTFMDSAWVWLLVVLSLTKRRVWLNWIAGVKRIPLNGKRWHQIQINAQWIQWRF